MISSETLLTFSGAAIVLALAPGPDNILVLMQSALKGKKAGIVVTMGLCTGLLFHTCAVAFGIAALIRASEPAFIALKLIGAAYLLFLACKAFKAKPEALAQEVEDNLDIGKLYRRGLLMNITNPKVSIFFLAFLPQFVTPHQGNVSLQIFILGAVFLAWAAIVFSAISVLGGKLAKFLGGSPSLQQALNKTAAAVFAALACKLAVSESR